MSNKENCLLSQGSNPMQPELAPPFNAFPVWWHHHGSKFRLDKDKTSLDELIIVLQASAASVTIQGDGSDYWQVSWTVITYGATNGSTLMRDHELLATFTDAHIPTDELSQWLISRYGGDYAIHGKCIRWKNFLNIPCPGTGHDGDPNVSILLNDEISQVVKELLANQA